MWVENDSSGLELNETPGKPQILAGIMKVNRNIFTSSPRLASNQLPPFLRDGWHTAGVTAGQAQEKGDRSGALKKLGQSGAVRRVSCYKNRKES